jgi:hypothetical protein
MADHLHDRCFLALDVRLDAAVGTVPDPAAHI